MIVLDQRRLLWVDRLAFYPDREQLLDLAGGLRGQTVLRVRQSSADVTDLPALASKRPFRTACVALGRTDDELLKAVHSTSRNLIRQAQRRVSAVDIRWDPAVTADDFLTLYRGFTAAKRGVPHLRAARLRQYAGVSEMPVAYVSGAPVCGHLMLLDRQSGRVRLNLSASRRMAGAEEARTAAMVNRYLHWCELLRYRDAGFLSYDFGGIGSGTGAVATFKLSFGGSPVTEHDYVLAGGSARVAVDAYQAIRGLARRLPATHRS